MRREKSKAIKRRRVGLFGIRTRENGIEALGDEIGFTLACPDSEERGLFFISRDASAVILLP
jgi:hypothetical protein